MMRRFAFFTLPVAALLLGACGGPETLDAPEVSPEPAVATTEQGLSSITINDFPLAFYKPPKTPGGDADFGGNGPRMTLNFEYEVRNSNELWIGMFIWGDEVGGDTHVAGHQWYHIATTATPIQSITPSPWPVADFWQGAEYTFSYRDYGHSQDAFYIPQLTSNTRIVQNITCVGDTAGDEAGTKTGCSAVLHDLTITF
ncbi:MULTISPECIES: hypothetical protein [unclassified Corallococcus]|uniref:hypothetical protein n=1 Tax=unclassified Corallococcus TaxID=2685029 RepID=UPI001A905907|nr:MULTISPECIES: hypothetical protein [unclassified Corallococcus]MBN9687460.1 hypothetical protein [Corallococcus sp. NCSPR001]WAS88716.1 hypothetical protein O0N60_17420 [Corallococcus sp. NCRR]